MTWGTVIQHLLYCSPAERACLVLGHASANRLGAFLWRCPRDRRGVNCLLCFHGENRATLRTKVLLLCFSFRLDDCNLSSSNCEDLSSIISTNPSLTELKLNNNELGDAGIEYLCKGLLMPSCSLQKLW